MKNEWLAQFENENTKRQYEISLKQFEEHVGETVKTYVEDLEWGDFWEDLQGFWKSLSDKAPKTQNNRVRVVKLFFQDHGIEIPDSEWSKFRRRRMKASRPQTQDRAGKKEEWRKIIMNMSTPQGQALYLTLLSTGARIGEILQILKDDLDLESDPGRINLRAEYTKGGVGDRIIFLTDEAELAIKQYLDWREGKKNSAGVSYDETSKVFPFTQQTARKMLYSASERAGLDMKDRNTGRREIHTHSTRKFFRSNCGLGEALTHAIMGHREYLDQSYLRVDPDRAAKEFKKNMGNLKIFESEENEEITTKLKVRALKTMLEEKGVSNEEMDELGKLLSQNID
ncbi:hypothetical protein AKJ50_01910 [candidate division MSBL1 archaeon SCGC-AAA382A13]|uniref:Tyr recombinase domain-containing protein n=1 Tax=candidate division MSBL1 archaeon SCGC-AAA382A13 TaxID=1698279 RepID=A0A133VEQ3_9EURY|nr:hypothetical protein AKJ50_01910 [candidate division MSBL1 archaeon SCGC-AAA382A13]